MAGSARFAVLASGGGLSYQWFGPDGLAVTDSDGQISGSNSATLVILNVGSDNVGNYSVRVVNAAGFVDSDVAALTIGELRLVVT